MQWTLLFCRVKVKIQMSSEKRKAEPSADNYPKAYLKMIYDESAPKLCQLEPIECFREITKRAEEFETKVLPLVKETLGDQVKWLKKPVVRVQDSDTWKNCRPFPLIHFATFTMVSTEKDVWGQGWFRDRWWCYCPTNDWIVVTSGRDGSPEAYSRVSDIDQLSRMLKPLKGFRAGNH
jgi:hypothetical protein